MSKLKKLLPESIAHDEKVSAAAEASDRELSAVDQELDKLYILSRIDQLPEPVLDLLAWQFHVEGYGLAQTREEKASLVKNAILVHRYKGTPYAVKKVFEILNIQAVLREWYETSGQPYTFEVELLGVAREDTPIAKLIELINEYKNVRSHLGRFDFTCITETSFPVSSSLELAADFHLPLKMFSKAQLNEKTGASVEVLPERNLISKAESFPTVFLAAEGIDLSLEHFPDMPTITREASFSPVVGSAVEIDTGGAASALKCVYEFASFSLSARGVSLWTQGGAGLSLSWSVPPVNQANPFVISEAPLPLGIAASVDIGESLLAGRATETFLYVSEAKDISLASAPIITLEV